MLGWLLDPQHQQVETYQPGKTVEILENPPELFGEEVLSGFVLNLCRIYN
ncbi:hypothetical protein [Rivularia sp. PCC 7116]